MISRIVKLSENTLIKAEEDCQYLLLIKDFDRSKVYNFTLNMEKSGVEAEIIGIFNMKTNYHLNLSTTVNHKKPNTKCETRINAVLNDHAGIVYQGKIIIEKKAQVTSSYLENKTLVVGEDTLSRSQPILQIDANDVRASHGSATGRIDENQLYYLTSRGYNKQEAQELIINGFFESELREIIDDKAKNIMERYIK